MLICDKCGSTAEKGKFCKGCGGPLREFFTVKQTSQSSVVLTCTKCGKGSSDGRFCIFCGGELDVARQNNTAPVENSAPVSENAAGGLVCSKCGKSFEKGKFCTVCGGDLVPSNSADKSAERVSASAPTLVSAPVNVPASAALVNTAENKASGLVCSKCGKSFEKGKFCTVCGGNLVPANNADKLAESAPASVPSPVPTPVNAPTSASTVVSAGNKESGLVCSKCGKSFEKGKFCTVCGGDLVSAVSASNAETDKIEAAKVITENLNNLRNSALNTPLTDIPAPDPSVNNSVGKAASDLGQGIENAAFVQPAPEKPTDSGRLICEGCGKEFEKGKFCTVCGGNLIPAGGNAPAAKPVVPVAPPTASPSAQGGTLRCTSCGNIMSKGKFCTVCGGSLAPFDGAPAPATPTAAGLHCPQCGKTFTQGKFCTVCGIPLVN